MTFLQMAFLRLARYIHMYYGSTSLKFLENYLHDPIYL